MKDCTSFVWNNILQRPSVSLVLYASLVTETFAFRVNHNLGATIAMCVICGCRTKNLHTIAVIVAFVGSVVENIFDIATIVACALIPYCLTITTARLENTCPIVPSVRKICLVRGTLRMKCHAGMRFIGIVSRS